MGDVVPIAVMPPGLDVTVYPVITLPPVLDGATKATLAEAFPAVATTLVGASGTVAAGAVVTVIVPVASTLPHTPVKGIV